MLKLWGTTAEAETELIRRLSSVLVATDFHEEAQAEAGVAAELRLVFLVSAAEAILGERDESKFRLALRLALLNGGDAASREQIFADVKRLYDLRSGVIHGRSGMEAVRSRRAIREGAETLAPLVRASLLYAIAAGAEGRDAFVARVDRALVEPAGIAEVRARANRFWELGDTDAEILYTASVSTAE